MTSVTLSLRLRLTSSHPAVMPFVYCVSSHPTTVKLLLCCKGGATTAGKITALRKAYFPVIFSLAVIFAHSLDVCSCSLVSSFICCELCFFQRSCGSPFLRQEGRYTTLPLCAYTTLLFVGFRLSFVFLCHILYCFSCTLIILVSFDCHVFHSHIQYPKKTP